MSKSLYYYTDFHSHAGWFASMSEYRREFPNVPRAVRVAHQGIEAPAGYRKTGRELANDPAVRVPTMRDLVSALSPGA